MGNNSIKSSADKKLKKTNKKSKSLFCCSNSSHSFSNDEKYLPTFDRISSNKNPSSTTLAQNVIINLAEKKKELSSKKRVFVSQSIEDLQKSLHGTDSINQWIESLPILPTPLFHQPKTKQIECHSIENNELIARILTIKSNREFVNITKNFHLNFYLQDYLNRLQTSQTKQTFKSHFLSSKIIYPCNDISRNFIDDLDLRIIAPPESIVPSLLINTKSSYKIHEQTRSKCYFIPLTDFKIEPNDEDYKQKSIQLDRTHVVISLENNRTTKTSEIPVEFASTFVFVSNDSFQTGFLRIDQDKITKELLPFISHSSDENVSYLSSDLIQQWFNTLILINQTCTIVKRFLIGDRGHITCLFKERTNKENSSPSHNNLIFASLRLPSCTYSNDSSSSNHQEEKTDTMTDAFSPVFLSDMKKLPTDTIYIDYERYSFAFLLDRWPKILIDNYYTHPKRYSKRRWPSKHHMNILVKKSLILIPNDKTHQWEINFDLIEEHLFELMNELTLYFYILCQQLFSLTYEIRLIIKHCFLNYCEKYGVPFSNNQNNISDLINRFLQDISQQINKKFIPNYFNHQINLLNSKEDYNRWFDYINKCLHDRVYLSSISSLVIPSNRSIIIEFLFHFVDQLYRTFHMKRSEFYLNDTILVDLHKQLCEKLSNDQNIFFQKSVNDLLNNKEIIENIQMNLTHEFETNAELVHTCLNQIRKAQPSLIFHYTWTIFIQYLHTYYDVLWNMGKI